MEDSLITSDITSIAINKLISVLKSFLDIFTNDFLVNQLCVAADAL